VSTKDLGNQQMSAIKEDEGEWEDVEEEKV
jgi:hypothetical protein